MKKYLMTWYGITDLRASLELEQSTGPVLGALLAEEYTDVFILGFTHSDKTRNQPNNLQQKIADINISNQATVRQFVDQFSNSEEAHNHFNQWLENQLKSNEKKTKVHFQAVSMSHLNDTESIYEAATESLDIVASIEGEKLTTLYLSPGTPVMAFVWAFAGLKHPNLKKRMIASSAYNKPPETISLPNEWLEWHGKQLNIKKGSSNVYDVIFHLFGEQRMPSLLGINQFECSNHVFVNSKQYPASVMKQFIGDAEFFELPVDPYKPEDVRAEILKLVDALPLDTKIGFNLTGGTKLMYAGALSVCRKINATPFYFDSKSNNTVFLNDFKTIPTKKIDSVESFINLNSDSLSISKPGYWERIKNIDCEKRESLTQDIWTYRSKFSRLYKSLVRFNDSPQAFELLQDGFYIKLNKEFRAEIKIGNREYKFDHWPNFAQYLSGGWFEEYTYKSLRPLLDTGEIKDLRIGLEISVNDEKGFSYLSERNLYQEIDLMFTDGVLLYIVECKAGSVKSEQVMKLQNITRYFGGITGKGIFSCCFSPTNKVVQKKISDARNVDLVSGANLIGQIRKIIFQSKKTTHE